MRLIHRVDDMQHEALRLRGHAVRIGFVPTMGFLHAGHLSLMRLAKDHADVVVVSIFVNPTQFGPDEDFDRYPRDPERDAALCEGAGVDILFSPPVGEMYAPDHSVYVEELQVSQGLCGGSRPGHFRGVATVVAELFNIVQPHVAVFGQKDAQQAAVIRRLVRDLRFPVDVRVAPIVREADGLAMSSRNKYLSADERRDAVSLSESLRLAGRLYRSGVRDAAELRQAVTAWIARLPTATIDYVEIVDGESLKPVDVVDDNALVLLAVKIGKTRLIDNTVISAGV